jgi:methionine aminopeptidase
MEIPTREQYENKISELQQAIIKTQKDMNSRASHLDRSKSTCPGMRGWRVPGRVTECDAWKADGARLWAQEEPIYQASIENAKKALWDYQKAVAKAEQDAQVEAVRQAIADQVRLEQERIQQSQQNQMIMEQSVRINDDSVRINDDSVQINDEIRDMHEHKSSILPFHENYLIPIIAIGGYLVLRS